MEAQKFKYEVGEYVSSNTIQMGKIVDTVQKGVMGESQNFYVVEELIGDSYSRKIKHFIPQVFERNLRILPKESQMLKAIDDVLSSFSIAFKKSQENPSRYKYLVSELKKPNFKKMIEIIYYLSALDSLKKISTSEKKLLKSKKEQLYKEVTFVTGLSSEEIDFRMKANILKLKEIIVFE